MNSFCFCNLKVFLLHVPKNSGSFLLKELVAEINKKQVLENFPFLKRCIKKGFCVTAEGMFSAW